MEKLDILLDSAIRIDNLYKKLINLESNGNRDSEEFRNIVSFLKSAIELEDKNYRNLDAEKIEELEVQTSIFSKDSPYYQYLFFRVLQKLNISKQNDKGFPTYIGIPLYLPNDDPSIIKEQVENQVISMIEFLSLLSISNDDTLDLAYKVRQKYSVSFRWPYIENFMLQHDFSLANTTEEKYMEYMDMLRDKQENDAALKSIVGTIYVNINQAKTIADSFKVQKEAYNDAITIVHFINSCFKLMSLDELNRIKKSLNEWIGDNMGTIGNAINASYYTTISNKKIKEITKVK